MAASTSTKDRGKTGPPASQLIADSEDADNHHFELSARDIARAEKVVGFDHGDSFFEDEISMSESEIRNSHRRKAKEDILGGESGGWSQR